MRKEIAKIRATVESLETVPEEDRNLLIEALEKLDKNTISKSHHKKIDRSRKNLLRTGVPLAIAGLALSVICTWIGYEITAYSENQKREISTQYLPIVNELTNARNYDDAEKVLAQAMQITPTEPVLIQKGVHIALDRAIYFGQIPDGLIPQAKLYFEKNPGDYKVAKGLGNLHELKGSYEEAIPYYSKALQIAEIHEEPGLIAVAAFDRGRAHSVLAEFDAAVRDLTRSSTILCSLDPTKVPASKACGSTLYELARLNYFQKHYSSALGYLQEALADARGDASLVASIKLLTAEIYLAQDQLPLADEAALDASSAFQTVKDNRGMALATSTRAQILAEQGRCNDATSNSLNAVEIAHSSKADETLLRTVGIAGQIMYTCEDYDGSFLYAHVARLGAINMGIPGLVETAQADLDGFETLLLSQAESILENSASREALRLGLIDAADL